jgi:general secretion pathway protein J
MKRARGYIPNFLQNAIFGLLLFALMASKKVRNRAGYYSLFSKPSAQKSSRPKHSILKELGYTLIEVMIALVVFAIIASISSSVMFHAFDIRGRVAKQADQLGEIQLTMTLLEHDTVQFIPRSIIGTDMHQFASFIGTSSYMEFTRGGMSNPQSVVKRSGLKRISYRCDGQQLIRRSWDVLDTPERQRFEDKVLLSHLETCSFRYISKYRQIMPEWHAYTNSQNQKTQALPSGIQLMINPFGWGTMTLLFVLPEGLYA